MNKIWNTSWFEQIRFNFTLWKLSILMHFISDLNAIVYTIHHISDKPNFPIRFVIAKQTENQWGALFLNNKILLGQLLNISSSKSSYWDLFLFLPPLPLIRGVLSSLRSSYSMEWHNHLHLLPPRVFLYLGVTQPPLACLPGGRGECNMTHATAVDDWWWWMSRSRKLGEGPKRINEIQNAKLNLMIQAHVHSKVG